MATHRKAFELSDEVRRLIAELQYAKEEEVLTYDRLGQIALCDIKEKNWVIQSALRILSRNHGLEFECVKNVGYVRIDDSGKVKKINKYNTRAYSSAKRGVQVSRNTDFDRLSNEDKGAFSKQSVISYFISGFSVIRNQELLCGGVNIDPRRLTQKDVDTASAVIRQFGKDVI